MDAAEALAGQQQQQAEEARGETQPPDAVDDAAADAAQHCRDRIHWTALRSRREPVAPSPSSASMIGGAG